MLGGEQRATDGTVQRWLLIVQVREQIAALWKNIYFIISHFAIMKWVRQSVA